MQRLPFWRLDVIAVAGALWLAAVGATRADAPSCLKCHKDQASLFLSSAHAQEKFAKTVEESLIANRDLLPDIVAQAKKVSAARYLAPASGEALHSSFPPTVDVYHELSMQRTIVEVQARDQIGLLYRLAKTISDHGFDITFARIGTERGVAIDTFYIENVNREPVEDNARLVALRDALNEVITPTPAAAPS